MWMQVGVEEGWTPLGANCLPRKMKDYSFLAKKKNKKNTPPPKTHTKLPEDRCCLFRHNSLSLPASQRQSLKIK